MLYIEGNTIRLTRGDTAFLTVPIENPDTGEAYEIAEDDTLVFSVKKFTCDTECLFQKTLVGSNVFEIKPEDTQGASVGRYKYDVQLTNALGQVFTVIEPSAFEVMEEVT